MGACRTSTVHFIQAEAATKAENETEIETKDETETGLPSSPANESSETLAPCTGLPASSPFW